MKKKIIVLTILATLMATLIGCGSDNASDQKTDGKDKKQQQEESVPESTEEVVEEPLEEPVPEPSEEVVAEPTEESVAESTQETVEEKQKYSSMIEYVHNHDSSMGIGIENVKAFVYADDGEKATVETTVKFKNAMEFIFRFDGDAKLGYKAISTEDGASGNLYNKDSTKILQVWNVGQINEEVFNQYKNLDLKQNYAWGKVDEYFEEVKEDTYVAVIFPYDTVVGDQDYTGYIKVILDLDKGIAAQFMYIVTVDSFDEQEAYDVVSSIKLVSPEESLVSEFAQ